MLSELTMSKIIIFVVKHSISKYDMSKILSRITINNTYMLHQIIHHKCFILDVPHELTPKLAS